MSSVLFLWPEELQFGCRGLSHSESPAEDIFLPMEPSGVNKVKSTSSSQQERLSYWKDSYTTQIILILYTFIPFLHLYMGCIILIQNIFSISIFFPLLCYIIYCHKTPICHFDDWITIFYSSLSWENPWKHILNSCFKTLKNVYVLL